MSYRIVVVHRDQDDLADELKEAVMNALEDMAQVKNLLEISDELADNGDHQVVVYLASEVGAVDNQVKETILAAVIADVAILPVVKSGEEGRISELLPESLLRLNAVSWEREGATVAIALLRLLGLMEVDRKIFISYRRSETTQLATQLHTALVQRRFDVFLDRFSVEYGEDFQRRLLEDLSDKAFVLLLESDRLRESPWVREEILFAQLNGIELRALKLPDCTHIVESIDDAFRFRLDENELTDNGELVEDVLERTVDDIEVAHANALRRRREQILGSMTNRLREEGCECLPVDDWCVLVTRSGEDVAGLFWVTPRRPTTSDFHGLSRQHDRIEDDVRQDLKRSVVHNVARLAEDHQEIMSWLADLADTHLVNIRSVSLDWQLNV